MEPVVEHLAARYAGVVTVVNVDVDANPTTAREFGVRTIPTLILFQHGEPVERMVGAQDRDFVEGVVDGARSAGRT